MVSLADELTGDSMQLADRPEIVVATPSRALSHLRSESLHLEHLDYLVIDEADLILSYGHSSEDIRSILSGPWNLPKVYQSFLMSATMTGEVEELKGIVLRNPVRGGRRSSPADCPRSCSSSRRTRTSWRTCRSTACGTCGAGRGRG